MNNNHYLRLWQVVLAVTLMLCPLMMRAQDEPETCPYPDLISTTPFLEKTVCPQSPTVWNMIRYGNADVDLFHGTPGLTIPLYTYQDQQFQIPVSLSYSSSGFMPGTGCGPAGKDWCLNAGGVITREVRGIPDEYTGRDYHFKWYGDPRHRRHFLTIPFGGGTFTEQDYEARSIINVAGYSLLYNKPAAPDSLEYVYSGALGQEYLPYYPDSTYTVLGLRGFETESDIYHFSFLGVQGSFYLCPGQQIKVFGCNVPSGDLKVAMSRISDNGVSFTIDWQGYRYFFNESENTNVTDTGYSGSTHSMLSSWKLTRIEAPLGQYAVFQYGVNNAVSSCSPSINVDRKRITLVEGTNNEWESEGYDIYNPPISNVNTTVQSKELTSITIPGRVSIQFSYTPDCILSGMTVLDADSLQIRTCSLEQTTKTATCRLLKRLTIAGEGVYTFHYIDESNVWPDALNIKALDLFGYYNGSDAWTHYSIGTGVQAVSQYASQIVSARQPNEQKTLIGMLDQVEWPSGGKTVFTYEQNRYQYEPFEYGLYANSQMTGGVRIRSITSYDTDGTLRQTRRFTYQTSTGESSGVLLSRPELYWHYSVGATDGFAEEGNSDYFLHIDREAVTSSTPIGYGLRSHIEYTRVIEEVTKEDGGQASRTVYEFAPSYGDGSGRIEYDSQNAMSSIQTSDTWGVGFQAFHIANRDSYFTAPGIFSGKPVRKTCTDQNGKVSLNEEIEYGTYSPAGGPDTSPVVRLCKRFTHQIWPQSAFERQRCVTSYDLTGSPIMTTEVNRTVTSLGHLQQQSHVDSRGRNLQMTLDYNTSCPYLPETRIEQIGGMTSKAEKIEYEIRTSLSSPSLLYALPFRYSKGTLSNMGSVVQWRPIKTILSYDVYGNPTQLRDSTGKVTSIVWTSDGLYPASVTEGGPGGLTTLYEWRPLVGMTKKTDPSGRYQTFEYDAHGRLVAIKDEQGNLVQRYEYNVVTDNNNQ